MVGSVSQIIDTIQKEEFGYVGEDCNMILKF